MTYIVEVNTESSNIREIYKLMTLRSSYNEMQRKDNR